MAEMKRKRITHHFEKEARRSAALKRQAQRDNRTIDQQIELIKTRPGNSAKELKKLEVRKNRSQ